MYGLPKIHKPNIPLRPIVSCIGLATYHLPKELTRIISPLMGKTSSYVKDSGDFVKIKDIQVDVSTTLVSFDVVSRVRVAIDETFVVFENKLTDLTTELGSLRVETVRDLLHLCLTTSYFACNGKMYEQTEGAVMGNPLSPVVTNIFMEHFEELAISTSATKPATWLRYIDNTFAVWR